MISRTVDALIHAFSYSGSIFAAIRASETISKPPSKTKKRSKHPITPSTTRYQSGFEVRPSSLGGFGAFATRHLTKDEVILVESPLLRANHSTVLRNYNQLPRADRKAAQQLHAGPHFKEGTIHIEKVWYTNCFTTVGDEAGLFLVASRFNHACTPADNIEYEYDLNRGCLVLKVLADNINSGEELFISYGRGRTPDVLFLWYGFRCACGACASLTEEEAEELLRVDW